MQQWSSDGAGSGFKAIVHAYACVIPNCHARKWNIKNSTTPQCMERGKRIKAKRLEIPLFIPVYTHNLKLNTRNECLHT